MLYSIDYITRMTRVYIDRNPTTHHVFGRGDADTLDLDDVIHSHITDAVEYVYTHAPAQVIAEAAVDMDVDDVYWHHPCGDLCQGHVLLPRDFLRLYIFEMSDWHKPVYTAITPEMPAYDIARSAYSGVCATPYRPVCALAESSEGTILEFFSCVSDQAQVVQAKYLRRPEIEHHHIDMPRRCLGYVIHDIGVRTLTTIGEAQQAQHLLNISPYTLS